MIRQSKKSRIVSMANRLLSTVGFSIQRTFKSPVLSTTVISTAQGQKILTPIDHNSRERVNEYYSNPQALQDYLEPKRIAAYHSLIDLCVAKGIDFHQKTIADVGCGTGHILKFISEQFPVKSLTGFEYSEAALRVAQEVCPKASFVQFDVYEGVSQRFDVLLCVEVLEHLLHPGTALKNCLQMLAENGVLVITVPDGRKDTFLGHINFWSPESWKVYIEITCEGFECETGLFLDNEANFAIIRNSRKR